MAQNPLEAGNYFDQGFIDHARSLGVQMNRTTNSRVVIVGSEALTPLGDLDQTWQGILEGKSAVRAFPEAQNWRTNVAAPLPNSPSEVFAHLYTDKERLQKREGEATILADGLTRTLAQRLDLLDSEGKLRPDIDRSRFGLWIGSGIGDAPEIADVEIAIQSGSDRVLGSKKIDLNSGIRLFPQALIGPTSRRIGSQGSSGNLPAACATGSFNITQLFKEIKGGYLDAGIAGGVEYAVNSHPGLSIGVFAVNRVTSARNDEPERASRPFDADRDGFVPGSGGAVTMLASETFAIEHGLPIIGEVLGGVNTMDAHHVTALDPRNVARTYTQPLVDEANQVIYRPDAVGAHATSTKLGDIEEAKSIRLAFGDEASEIPVFAIKGSVSHLLGAVGALNFIVGPKIIEEGIIPHTTNLENVDPKVAESRLDLVMGAPRRGEVLVYLAGSFGFDNYSNAMVVGKYVR